MACNTRSLPLRQALLGQTVAQRQTGHASGQGLFLNDLAVQLPADADAVTREFWEFDRTPRGMSMPQDQTLKQTQKRMLSCKMRLMYVYPFNGIDVLAPRPVLFVSGDLAHSKEFSEDVFQRTRGTKELFFANALIA